MADATISRLSSTPWAAALINNAKWTPANTPSRLVKPSGEDSFFAETLSTDRAMRTCLTLKPAEASDGDWAYTEIVTLVEVGDGLNGYPQIIHGGFAATMLDEVCGVLIQLNTAAKVEQLKRTGCPGPHTAASYFTAYLNTSYRKPVPTPGVILCTARLERVDGRKLYIRGTVEDGAGTVYTISEAMFLKIITKL